MARPSKERRPILIILILTSSYGNSAKRARSAGCPADDNRYQFDGQTVGSSPQLLSHDYSHDANGNVTAISYLINSTKNKTFGYDALDRLTAATGPWPSSGSLSYTYDSVGNRLTEGGTLGSSAYTYSDNLLTDITGAKNKTFSYDANGNTITENNRLFTYAQNNRLIQVTENSATLGTYTHDGQGRRVKKVAGGQTTYFFYDQQSRLIAESNGTGTISTEYVYLPDRPLVKIDMDGSNETVLYYHTDHLGTPLFMTNSSGQKVWSAELLPFGEGYDINEDVDGDQVHVINNLRFPGQYYDAESGLHYNVMRDYNPLIGRYAQSDPIGLVGGINTFVYVESNPVNLVDPSGQLAFLWHFGITLAATGSLNTAWNAMAVDFAPGSQGTNAEVTQQHAMAGFDSLLNRYQTREEAIAATNIFIQKNISSNLAGAIHAGQDFATPKHAGEELIFPRFNGH